MNRIKLADFWALFVLVLAVAVCVQGCDGIGGLEVPKRPAGGDQRPDQDDDDGPPPGDGIPDTPPPDPFERVWMTSYGDDMATSATPFREHEYTVRLDLKQTGTTLSGSGTMLRMFKEGSSASDKVSIVATGTVSTNNKSATLTLESRPVSAFRFNPVWQLRRATGKLVGIYAEVNPDDGKVVRSGHAVWHKTVSGSVDDSWVYGSADSHSVLSNPGKWANSGLVSLARNGASLDGSGNMVEQRRSNGSVSLSYDISRGAFVNSTGTVGMTFANLQRLDSLDFLLDEQDWFGFFSGTRIVAAYTWFDEDELLTRFGHTTLFRAANSGPGTVTDTWVASFGDNTAASGEEESDYLASIELRAQEGNVVIGNAKLLDGSVATPVFSNYVVENSTIDGANLHLELRGNRNTFMWDLYVTSFSTLVGSYQRLDSSGNVLGQGIGEWRQGSENANIRRTWHTAYYDTTGVSQPPSTQLVEIGISRIDSDGTLTGTGRLRFAGDTRVLTFGVVGVDSASEAIFELGGGTVFGTTTWHLLKADDKYLMGVYTDRDSEGKIESRGHSLWRRTD